jgi:glycosyltransferase involved in cell wall biosynthesis
MKVLWLKTELLHPVDKGGKIRTYQMLKHLKRDHHVTYLTLDDGTAALDARERAEEYCHELISIPCRRSAKFSAGFYADLALNLASRLPYFIKKYESAEMRREIIRLSARFKYDLLVCDFLAPAINVPDTVACATLLFQHNVEAMIWKRHYEVQDRSVKRAYLRDQWRKAWRFERDACRRFDRVVAVSEEDGEVIRREYGVESVEDVPTGVDADYFRPSGEVDRQACNLVFTGSMDWLPNEDAIRYFIDQVMPRVKKAVPAATLTVVGRNPYPSLLEAARRDPSVIVTGRVEDVRPFMERAAAYIVPIRIGGGTRLKIYEAMAMGKAIISTSVGAEGLPVREGVELLLADTPEAFADAVARVITDEEFAKEIGARAAATVRERFGWDRVAAQFAAICERTIRQRGGGRARSDASPSYALPLAGAADYREREL